MGAWFIARASPWWTAKAAFEATIPARMMSRCRNCSTMYANWRARNRDDARFAHRERRAQRHGRRAAGVGLHADSAQTHPGTQEGHDRRLRDLMRFPGVLPDLSLPSGLGTFQKDRSHPLGLSEHPGHHTILAAAVPVLAIITLRRGLAARYDKHRRIAHWTLPIWLYVSVTGVVVYVMLYHF